MTNPKAIISSEPSFPRRRKSSDSPRLDSHLRGNDEKQPYILKLADHAITQKAGARLASIKTARKITLDEL
jgi:hypothetical protein